MKFYEPKPRDGYPCINVEDEQAYEAFLELDGTPRRHTWKPIVVRQVAMFDEKDAFLPSDFPWLDSALVLTSAAVVALRPMLEISAEILPLATVDETRLFVLNVRTVDALDEERSIVTRFPSTGKVMRIRKLVLREQVIEGIDLFKLPMRASPTYVSQRFVDAVASAELRGLEFKAVN